MLNNNTKKLVALGISLATLTGAIPTIISPIPVFASQEEGEQTPYDDAEGNNAGIDTTCTTSASVKVSNPLGEPATIVNLNVESDTGGFFEPKYVTISGIKFQLIDPISKYVSVVGESLEANANLVLPSKIQWNNETYTVTSIGERAFEKCNRLTNIVIPSSIKSIGNYAFFECNGLTKINVDADNNNYESNDGVLFNKNATKLIQYPLGKIDEKYEIPSSVTNISEYAFLLCSKLASIEVPSSVIKIEDYAFLSCDWKANYIVHNEDIKKYLLKCKSRILNFQITVVTLDTSKLVTIYDAYKKTSQGNYTDESFKVFTDALNYAKNVLDRNATATQTEVDNAEKALKKAINGLKEKVSVIGITVSGVDSIGQSGGNINLTVSVSPDDATNKNVIWSIVSGDNLASITQDGILTTSKSGNGSVTVRATAKDDSNVFGEKTITIATDTSELKNLYDHNEKKLKGNYTYESFKVFTDALNHAKNVLDKKTAATQTEVDNTKKILQEAINGLKEKVAAIEITVSGEDSISQSGGSTNLTVSINPDDATNKNVIWSIVNGANLANIDKYGTLTANKSGNGNVTVRATANDESGIYGYKLITIDNNGLYIITASAGVDGTITPYGILSITENNDSTYKIIPDLGYEINDVSVDGVSIGVVNSYTFENITTKHTISATFKVKNSTSSIDSSSKSKSSKIVDNSIDEATIRALNTKNIKTAMVNGNWYYLDNVSGYMEICWIISSGFLG